MVTLVVVRANSSDMRLSFQLLDSEGPSAVDIAILTEQRDLQFGKDNWVIALERPLEFLSDQQLAALRLLLQIDYWSAGSIGILSFLQAAIRDAYENDQITQFDHPISIESLPHLHRPACHLFGNLEKLSEGKIPTLSLLSELQRFGSKLVMS